MASWRRSSTGSQTTPGSTPATATTPLWGPNDPTSTNGAHAGGDQSAAAGSSRGADDTAALTIGGTVSLAVVLVCESDRWASTQSFVPPDMLGRYIAASRLVSWGMTPIAALAAGALAQTVGFRLAFGTFAALCLATAY